MRAPPLLDRTRTRLIRRDTLSQRMFLDEIQIAQHQDGATPRSRSGPKSQSKPFYCCRWRSIHNAFQDHVRGSRAPRMSSLTEFGAILLWKKRPGKAIDRPATINSCQSAHRSRNLRTNSDTHLMSWKRIPT
jgi:hypothetical protein